MLAHHMLAHHMLARRMLARHITRGSRSMAPVVNQIKHLIHTKPRTVAAVTAFCLSGAGDAIAQQAERTGDGAEAMPFNFKRTLAQACFSATYASQIYVPWIRLLDRQFSTARTLQTALLKASCDSLLLCPAVGLPTYYAWTSIAAGHSLDETVERFRNSFMSTLYNSWLIWCPIQLINFGLVASPYRVVFMYFGEIVWGMMASFTSRPTQVSSYVAAADNVTYKFSNVMSRVNDFVDRLQCHAQPSFNL